MKVKDNGKKIIITGLLLITAALCLTVYNIYDGIRAASAANEAAMQLENQLGRDSDDFRLGDTDAMPVRMLDGIEYSGIIEIPDLGVVLPIIDNCNNNNLKLAPCRYAGSVYQNNMVIAAHNYRNHFGKIKTLKQGADIYIIDMEGNVFEYTVSSLEVLDSAAVEEMKSSEWDLTLFTCTVGGKARVTIRCEKR